MILRGPLQNLKEENKEVFQQGVEFKCLLRLSGKFVTLTCKIVGLADWAEPSCGLTKAVWPEGFSCRTQILRCSRGQNFLVVPVEERIFYATTLHSNCSYKEYTVPVGPHWGFNKTNGKAPTDRVWPTATPALEVILHYIEKEENFQPIEL